MNNRAKAKLEKARMQAEKTRIRDEYVFVELGIPPRDTMAVYDDTELIALEKIIESKSKVKKKMESWRFPCPLSRILRLATKNVNAFVVTAVIEKLKRDKYGVLK